MGGALVLLTVAGTGFLVGRRTSAVAGAPVAAGRDAVEAGLRDGARGLFAQVTTVVVSQVNALPGLDLNRSADMMTSYFKGVADAIHHAPPEFFQAFRAELERTVCAGADDARLMMYARLGLQRPSLVTQQGLRCALAGHRTEDPVLWSLLDAWRVSGLPRDQLLAEVEAASRDERTRSRFRLDYGFNTANLSGGDGNDCIQRSTGGGGTFSCGAGTDRSAGPEPRPPTCESTVNQC
jgi:hypothetical protein